MAINTAQLKIRCAIYLPLFAPFGHQRIIADLARDAERTGWDGVFVWDDVAGWDRDMADPWITLSAAAMITERVRLGALITPLPAPDDYGCASPTYSLVRQRRSKPFDVIASGETPANQPDQAEELIAGYAAAGATWWLESLNPERSSGAAWSFDQLRERVLTGPLGKG